MFQATRPLFNPVPRHIGGTVGKNGGLFHQALLETDALAVLEINGGNNPVSYTHLDVYKRQE